MAVPRTYVNGGAPGIQIQRAFDQTAVAAVAELPRAHLIPIDPEARRHVGEITVDEIYRAPDAGSIELRTAMLLLQEALNWSDRGLDAAQGGDPILADDAMQHVQALLPELFCCRALGDGFGTLVSAIQSVFENLGGLALSDPQIHALRAALYALRSQPRISFETAVEKISLLERAGLDPNPPLAEELAEVLSE